MKTFCSILTCLFVISVTAQTNEIVTNQTIQSTFQNFTATGNYTGASLPVFGHKDDTKGSRYLFDKWVNGSVVNSKNESINNSSYLFNYDKLNKSLLVTTDKKSVIEVAAADLNNFVLKDEHSIYHFVHLSFINPNLFFIEIEKDSAKYSLYRVLKTKFIKSNYRNDGLTESGNNYDEYLDESDYYIIFPNHTTYKKIELKKKNIKEALVMESAKVEDYFSHHKNDELTEFYLKGLVQFLNR